MTQPNVTLINIHLNVIAKIQPLTLMTEAIEFSDRVIVRPLHSKTTPWEFGDHYLLNLIKEPYEFDNYALYM